MVGQRLFAGVKDDFYDLVHSLNSWKFWQTIAIMCVGLTFFSIGINAILVPHKFISSGATGIALILYYVFGSPSVGTIYWLLNIPILLVGWRTMSMKFVVLAVLGVFISGLTMQLTHDVRIPIQDPLMAAILAGVLTGGGSGLYLRFGGSAGGLDIVAAVVRRKWGIPMSTTFISVNAVNFILGGIINHSLEIAFYTAVAMVVHSRMIERMQTGFSSRKAALIVTSRSEEIAEQVMRRLNRGVTFLQGYGGRSQRSIRVIYTVVNVIELARLKEIIFHSDPKAFVAVTETAEVIGNRFVSWAQQGFEDKNAVPQPITTLLPGFGRTTTKVADTAAPEPPPPPHT